MNIPLNNDASAEDNEEFYVRMSNLALTTLPVTISDNAIVTITDDEGSAVVTIDDNSTLENSGSLTFTLTLNAATASGFTVEYPRWISLPWEEVITQLPTQTMSACRNCG